MNYRQPFHGEWPITQNYGETFTSSFHTGIDYGCPEGTEILASGDGVVRFAGFDQTGYGNCVIIEHDTTHATLYAHLSFITNFILGKKVKKGDAIGYSGNTGNSTGPHLHFEARSKWNDFRSHFNPIKLPLQSVFDMKPVSGLKEASDLGNAVMIVAPYGAFGHSADFSGDKRIFVPGDKFIFTGNTKQKDGLTFCECRPLSKTVWIAVHDGETQILDDTNE